MYSFNFTYQNGVKIHFEHIKEVKYSKGGTGFTVSEDKIPLYSFPTGYDLHLFSEGKNITINGKDLLFIEVQKET